ncbi:MAG TPA: hypothetical protein PKH79_06535 [Prolixibacteraceae bacterium]|nr:hypothetical protein [Prolixibacteraceae bacterium]
MVAWVVCLLLPLTFLISTTTKLNNGFTVIKKEKSEREKIEAFVKNEIDKNDYWFIEPTWESAPCVENGFVYGLSYCRHREKYLSKLVKLNPNIITYEGEKEKPKRWRITPVELDSLISTENTIHVYSTPGRNATILLKMLSNAASRCSIQLQTDTIYNDDISKRIIIRVNGIKTNFSQSPVTH